ncbi:hypothetical protein LJR034_008923 [Caballeronia sp. LjRoot34]
MRKRLALLKFSKLDTERLVRAGRNLFQSAGRTGELSARPALAAGWGAGNTLSSDGQFYPVGGIDEHVRQVNLRYGTRLGVTL